MTISNPFYTSEFHGDFDLVSVGSLDLEEGGQLPDCRLAIATFGRLNDAKGASVQSCGPPVARTATSHREPRGRIFWIVRRSSAMPTPIPGVGAA